MKRPPWLCAHRGASGTAPENTLAALRRAIELGVGMAEVDLQLTADGHLVLFHDTDLDRTSNGRGPLHRSTLAALRTLDAGSWFSPRFAGEIIPTLNELLDLARGRLRLNLELKCHGHEDAHAARAAALLGRTDAAPWCLVTSFDHDLMAELGDRLPGWKLGLIVGPGNWRDGLTARPEKVLSLHHSLITEDRVRRIRAAGKEIHVWTVDQPGEMKRLRAMGADVVITNHPEIAADETERAE